MSGPHATANSKGAAPAPSEIFLQLESEMDVQPSLSGAVYPVATGVPPLPSRPSRVHTQHLGSHTLTSQQVHSLH